MSKSCNFNLEGCLYYTVNSLARSINEMAEEAFKFTGISPAYAYVMIVILDNPGFTQVKIAKKMNLKASTMTRFIDKLIKLEYVEREQKGRNVHVYPTQKAKDFKPIIESTLKILHENYCQKLGGDFANDLTMDLKKANAKL